MSASSGDLIVTRSVLLELKDEHTFMREGHEFLDRKRTLLAGELVRRLKEHRRLTQQQDDIHRRAYSALVKAIALHGPSAAASFPAPGPSQAKLHIKQESFLGIRLPKAVLHLGEAPELSGSPELRRCRTAFRELVATCAVVAASGAGLRRLMDAYRRTERRTRALENVLIPELAQSIDFIQEQLDEADLEEAIRVRLRGRDR